MYTANVKDLTKEQLGTVINTQTAVMDKYRLLLKNVHYYLTPDNSILAEQLKADIVNLGIKD